MEKCRICAVLGGESLSLNNLFRGDFLSATSQHLNSCNLEVDEMIHTTTGR
jgi:hypothetical protein